MCSDTTRRRPQYNCVSSAKPNGLDVDTISYILVNINDQNQGEKSVKIAPVGHHLTKSALKK